MGDEARQALIRYKKATIAHTISKTKLLELNNKQSQCPYCGNQAYLISSKKGFKKCMNCFENQKLLTVIRRQSSSK